MPKGKRRVFSREFKLSAVKRMVAGERGRTLARASGPERHLRKCACISGVADRRPCGRPVAAQGIWGARS